MVFSEHFFFFISKCNIYHYIEPLQAPVSIYALSSIVLNMDGSE